MAASKFHRIELITLLIIVAIGSVLRLYNLSDTLLFRGDQGRDAIIAKRILKEGDIALIGPVTSVGNMYLGPFYYYFMVPFLALTYPDPVGPAYGVAIINCLSIIGLYFAARQLFNRNIALTATTIYALMPNAVQFSRFSWNPNLGAPVAVLLFWCLVRWYQTRQWKFALGLGLTLGIIVQLHYVTLTVWILAGITWLIALFRDAAKRAETALQGLVIGIVVFALLSPLVVFDYRHDHLISNRFYEFFTSSHEYMNPMNQFVLTIQALEGRMYQLFSQMMSGQKQVPFDKVIGYGSMLATAILWIKETATPKASRLPQSVAYGWLVIAIIGLAFYSSSIFDHYLTYCFPIVAIYWALLTNSLWNVSPLGKIAGVLVSMGLLFQIITGLKTLSFAGYGTTVIENTVNQTLSQAQPPYNIALIADNGDFQAMNYRYFFDVSSNPPQNNEEYLNLNTLVVIDEIQNGNPLSVPAYEIQAPGLTNLKQLIQTQTGPQVYIYQ